MWIGVNMIEVFNESNRTLKHVGMACSSELFVEVHWCTVNVVCKYCIFNSFYLCLKLTCLEHF